MAQCAWRRTGPVLRPVLAGQIKTGFLLIPAPTVLIPNFALLQDLSVHKLEPGEAALCVLQVMAWSLHKMEQISIVTSTPSQVPSSVRRLFIDHVSSSIEDAACEGVLATSGICTWCSQCRPHLSTLWVWCWNSGKECNRWTFYYYTGRKTHFPAPSLGCLSNNFQFGWMKLSTNIQDPCRTPYQSRLPLV